MPERGGPTTQSGILYQNSVAAHYLGRMCDDTDRPNAERVVRVRVEAPGHVDDIVVTYADEHTAYVHAKERIRDDETAWRALWRDFSNEYLETAFVRGRDRLRFHVGEATHAHQALRELCDRARTSQDAAEWRERLTAQQGALVDAIAPLLAPEVRADDATLHQLLAHLDVEQWPRSFIEDTLIAHAMPPTSVSAKTLFRLLRDRVGESRIRGTFEASTLRAALTVENQVDFRAAPDAQTLRTAVRTCGALLRQQRATIGTTGVHVERAVAAEVTTWALAPHQEQRVALLLDHAGRGKTVVMRDVLDRLEAGGAVVLALKADQQLSVMRDAGELQWRLELPGPVERVVAPRPTRSTGGGARGPGRRPFPVARARPAGAQPRARPGGAPPPDSPPLRLAQQRPAGAVSRAGPGGPTHDRRRAPPQRLRKRQRRGRARTPRRAPAAAGREVATPA